MTDIDKSESRIGDITNKIGLGMTAFGGAVTGILGGAVKGFSDYASTVDDAAKKTGFSTTATQEYKFAAEQCSATIEDITNATKFMNVSLAAGSDAYGALGLSVDKLRGMKPEEAFTTILSALSGVPDRMTQATLAQEIFGRGAMALAPLMAEGAGGIQKLRDEAHKLGIVMTEEDITAGEAFGDEMAKLKMGLLPIGADIARTLMPVIIDLANMLRNGAQAVAGFVREHPGFSKFIIEATAIVGGLSLVLGPLVMMISPLISLFGGLSAAVSGIGAAAGAAATAVGGFGLAGAALAAAPWVLGIAAIGAAFVVIADSVKKTVDATEQLRESEQRLTVAEAEYDATLQARGVALDQAAMAEMDFNQAMLYRNDMEKASMDALARAHLEHFLGRTETEREYAVAKNLMLNENISAEQAAWLVSLNLSDESYQKLMTGDAEYTKATMEQLGVRKEGVLQGDSAIAQSALDAAMAREQAWINAENNITTASAEANAAYVQGNQDAAAQVQSIWSATFSWLSDAASSTWDWLAGLFGNGPPAPAGEPQAAAGGGYIDKSGMVAGDMATILAGEEGPEAATDPEGNVSILGSQGPGLFNVPVGTFINTASETSDMFGGAFAQGGKVTNKQHAAIRRMRAKAEKGLKLALKNLMLGPDAYSEAWWDLNTPRDWAGFEAITGLSEENGEILGITGTSARRGGAMELKLLPTDHGLYLKTLGGVLELKNIPRFAGGGVVGGRSGGVTINGPLIASAVIREDADIEKLSRLLAEKILAPQGGYA